jgi:hypothetical protein
VNELGQGLTLSLIGILVTFAALGTLILLALFLKRVLPPQDQVKAAGGLEGAGREALKAQAAAAGVAALLEGKKASGKGDLGRLLERPVGNWWKKGIDRIQGKE